MLVSLVFRLLEALDGQSPPPGNAGPALLVRLRPEYAGLYPAVPAGVWLGAHRRTGDEGVVWLRSALPLVEWHVELRGRDDPAEERLAAPPARGL
jgi:hypothetical protein